MAVRSIARTMSSPEDRTRAFWRRTVLPVRAVLGECSELKTWTFERLDDHLRFASWRVIPKLSWSNFSFFSSGLGRLTRRSGCTTVNI